MKYWDITDKLFEIFWFDKDSIIMHLSVAEEGLVARFSAAKFSMDNSVAN